MVCYLEDQIRKSKKDPNKFTNINGIFKQSKKLYPSKGDQLNMNNIDGLIYMPAFLSVRGMDENIVSKSINGVVN